jgi:hypothetical protein
LIHAASILLALFVGASAPDAAAPADGPTHAQQRSAPVLVEPPRVNKPGETIRADGGQPPAVNPDLQGRSALPDSIGDAPLGPPGPPQKPPPAR